MATDNTKRTKVVIKENLPAAFAYRETGTNKVFSHRGEEKEETFAWAVENFMNEAKTITTLNHPNNVTGSPPQPPDTPRSSTGFPTNGGGDSRWSLGSFGERARSLVQRLQSAAVSKISRQVGFPPRGTNADRGRTGGAASRPREYRYTFPPPLHAGDAHDEEETKQADSLYQQARHYATGDGVVQDDAEAIRWYLKAAELGHAQAQRTLGECYQNGRGAAADPAEAAKWCCKAAERGDDRAKYALRELARQGNSAVHATLRELAEHGAPRHSSSLGCAISTAKARTKLKARRSSGTAKRRNKRTTRCGTPHCTPCERWRRRETSTRTPP